LSRRCGVLLAHAAHLAEEAAEPPNVIVFTGGRGRGARSEAEEMLASWPGRTDVEFVLEPTAATTAQNAARSLPLLLARGVGEAAIVCAPLHAPRVRYFFGSLFESFGVRCQVRPVRSGATVSAAAWELAATLVMRRQLRAARAELEARG